jgi:hypothetical protein
MFGMPKLSKLLNETTKIVVFVQHQKFIAVSDPIWLLCVAIFCRKKREDEVM